MVNLKFLKMTDSKLPPKIQNSDIPYMKMLEGTTTPIIGTTDLKFYLGHKPVTFKFYIIPDMYYSAILGLDFFLKFYCILDYDSQDFIPPNYQS